MKTDATPAQPSRLLDKMVEIQTLLTVRLGRRVLVRWIGIYLGQLNSSTASSLMRGEITAPSPALRRRIDDLLDLLRGNLAIPDGALFRDPKDDLAAMVAWHSSRAPKKAPKPPKATQTKLELLDPTPDRIPELLLVARRIETMIELLGRGGTAADFPPPVPAAE